MTKCRYQWTKTRLSVLSVSLFLTAACSGAAMERSSPTGTASSAPAGLTSIDASVFGAVANPGFTVQAPPGWSSPDGRSVLKHGPGVLGLSVWQVSQVPRNPCHPLGHLYDPGPTLGDLVTALETQPLRHATAPTDVTLGGYSGRYLTWSAPAHWVVTGNADFKGCDVQSNGHRDFVNWYSNMDAEAYTEVAGQVDRLWVLDVKGQRLLIDATYSPDTTQAERVELAKIVDSLRLG
jgi:hypothetical protein